MLLVSHDRAVLDAVARRTLAIEDGAVRDYEGGWADYARARRASATLRRRARSLTQGLRAQSAQRPLARRGASADVERLEAEIEAKELEVRDLERRLAEDWANVDTAAAYRRSRDELDALLETLGGALRARATA